MTLRLSRHIVYCRVVGENVCKVIIISPSSYSITLRTNYTESLH